MTGSTKQTAALSFATQISTKAINLGLSILFVRLVPATSVGTFTLLIAAAQLVCSLGRVGTNYSYAVLLPEQKQETDRLQLTTTYSFFGLACSLIVALIALSQLTHATGISELTHQHLWLFCGLTLAYLLSDSVSETIWSIHLALGRFKAVFLRDVWLALGKGCLPLAGALWLGPLGVATGLGLISVLNCWIASTLLRRHSPGLTGLTGAAWISWPLLRQLLLKGVPFFSVPLVSNLILWPLLMSVVNSSGIARLDGLRVAQICAQVIGVISASLIPVLLVKSSQHTQAGLQMHQKAFQACWVISMLIYGVYALSDRTLLPLIFGVRAGDGAIQIARILVAAAAVQGLSQIPMQRPLSTRTLIQLSLLQIISLIMAALVAILIFDPTSNGLLAYASINLLSPLITVLCLPAVLGQNLMPGEHTPWLQIGLSMALLTTCYLINGNPIQISLLVTSLGLIVYGNRGLIHELKPGR